MATLADVLRNFTPPTESVLADPIKQHIKALPKKTAQNIEQMNWMVQNSNPYDYTGGKNPYYSYDPKAAEEFANYVPNLMGATAPKKYIGKTLEGMPELLRVGNKIEQFGTDQRLVDIAKEYAENKGIIYNPQTKYAEVSQERALRLAKAYEEMANNPNNYAVKKSYDSLINETMGQYEALRKKGYKFNFMPESGDIYGNPRNAINDVVTNKHLSVYPTVQGFGGISAPKASETNPLLMRIGEKWNGQEVTANDVFRAVHDVFGHSKHGVGFRAAGEENAFQAHAKMFSPEALPALASETRGQNSWVNFGPYAQKNLNANPLLTEYAEQKTGLLPSWAWTEGILK
jgi:hypothetical protein